MSLPVILLGGGGHAKVLVEALAAKATEILGYVAPHPCLEAKSLLGIPYLGGDGEIFEFPPEHILLVNGVGSTKDTILRKRLFEYFKDRGYQFGQVIHPSAVISSDVDLQEGAQIMAGAVIQPGVSVGRNSIVNTCASIDHDCLVGDHCHVGPGVTFSGGVKVGCGSHIGTGVIVIQNVNIGRQCLIGAGSLVLTDVPDEVKAFGAPAKVVSQ